MEGFWGRIWQRLAGGGRPNDLPVEGLIGVKLADILDKHQFFTWFCFEKTGEEKLPDGKICTAFQPNGPAFRSLVTLYFTTDEGGVIRELRLALARSFIGSPSNCTFAADLAGSFLRDAGETGVNDAIGALSQEIQARTVGLSSAPVITRHPLPEASGEPSRAYQTYAGGSKSQTLRYRSGKLQMVLRQASTDPGLVEMIVSPAR